MGNDYRQTELICTEYRQPLWKIKYEMLGTKTFVEKDNGKKAGAGYR